MDIPKTLVLLHRDIASKSDSATRLRATQLKHAGRLLQRMAEVLDIDLEAAANNIDAERIKTEEKMLAELAEMEYARWVSRQGDSPEIYEQGSDEWKQRLETEEEQNKQRLEPIIEEYLRTRPRS